jgi:uncharacterized membrane protein YtjA (UPF0391 family)
MFDLEEKISEWRQQMLAAGIKSPVPLEELESHLREGVQELTASGMEPQEALAAAIKKFGLPIPLQAEFTQVDKKSRLTEQYVIKVLVYTIWFCLVLPTYLYTFYKYDMNWAWRSAGIANIIFGTFLILYCKKINIWFPIIPNRLRRQTIGISAAVCGVAGMVLFMNFILPHFSLTMGQVVVAVLCGLTVMSIGGGIQAGLEEAAKRSTTTTA